MMLSSMLRRRRQATGRNPEKHERRHCRPQNKALDHDDAIQFEEDSASEARAPLAFCASGAGFASDSRKRIINASMFLAFDWNSGAAS